MKCHANVMSKLVDVSPTRPTRLTRPTPIIIPRPTPIIIGQGFELRTGLRLKVGWALSFALGITLPASQIVLHSHHYKQGGVE